MLALPLGNLVVFGTLDQLNACAGIQFSEKTQGMYDMQLHGRLLWIPMQFLAGVRGDEWGA